jgi:hypothetical protein
MNWEPGRQGSGYFKKKLFHGKWWDCYVLKYPKGSYIDHHYDPAPEGKEHHRLNIVLKRANGGNFYTADGYNYGRMIYFRPDIIRHGVSFVLSGTRYVLSIGWLRNESH